MGLGKYLLKEGEGSYQNIFVCDVCFLNLLAILPYVDKKRRSKRNITPLCLPSPRCINGYQQYTAGGGGVTLRWTSILSRGGQRYSLACFMLRKPGLSSSHFWPLAHLHLYLFTLPFSTTKCNFPSPWRYFCVFLLFHLNLCYSRSFVSEKKFFGGVFVKDLDCLHCRPIIITG